MEMKEDCSSVKRIRQRKVSWRKESGWRKRNSNRSRNREKRRDGKCSLD
jgi:hypothetical protein